MAMEPGMDNTLTNNISQHPGVDPSDGIRGAEPSVSDTGLVDSCAPSSTPHVAGEDELQSQGLTQDVVCRQLPIYCRLYVDRFVQGVDASITIDMGVVNSLVSHILFRKINEDHCPRLAKTAPVDAARGEPLKIYGKAVIENHMGPLCFEHKCVVSDIADEFLLGEDLMLCDPSGPADIIQSEERMIFCGVSIPLKLVKPPTIRRVTVAECLEVPPMEEVIVDAYVDRNEHVIDEEEHQLLVEMHPNLPQGYGCLLAPMVVNAANITTVPVHIFNPQSKPIAIRQDSVVGQAEPVKVEYAIAKHENQSEIGNDSAARHVTLRERRKPKGKVHPSGCQARLQRQSIARKANIQVPASPLPEHLRGLYEQSAKGKSKMECAQIHSLLLKHEQVFSKDDYDLDHTKLVEHTIVTWNAKPIDQPPR